MAILKAMQKITYRDSMPIYRWLEEIDLDEPGTFATPTGFTIKLEPES